MIQSYDKTKEWHNTDEGKSQVGRNLPTYCKFVKQSNETTNYSPQVVILSSRC